MDCFIKKIAEGKIDDSVHLQFQKFSRGTFKDRASMKAKNSADKITLSTTAEYSNELVRSVAEKLGNEKTTISGVIVSTSDLTGKIPFSDKKQFMGIKQYVINGEMSGLEIIKLCDALPDAFFALSFKTSAIELKIKPKAPKSAKPSTSDKEAKIDFCSVKTTDKTFVKQFIFESDNFKEMMVRNTFVIEDITIPQKYSSPEEMRKLAKRKGKIVSEITIDGIKKVKEYPFVA